MVTADQVVDSRTGHRMVIGQLAGVDPLWGFYCVTCERWFTRKLSTIQPDDFDGLSVRLSEEHFEYATAPAQLNLPL